MVAVKTAPVPSNDVPDGVAAALAMQPPADASNAIAAAEDVIVRLHAFTPAEAVGIDVDSFEDAEPAASTQPAVQPAAIVVWDGDEAAAQRARSGQY
jgi:hypothetical protein